MRKHSTAKRTGNSTSKMTPFELAESSAYEVYYTGQRRIHLQENFTDAESEPIVHVGDSIAYKYEVVGSLGRGSFGKVFKAYDHKKKEYVALKIIKSQVKFTQQAKI